MVRLVYLQQRNTSIDTIYETSLTNQSMNQSNASMLIPLLFSAISYLMFRALSIGLSRTCFLALASRFLIFCLPEASFMRIFFFT